MKKLLQISLLLFVLLAPQVMVPAHSGAVNVYGTSCRNNPDTSVCKEATSGNRENPFIKIITVAINIVSILAGIAAVIGIMVSGIRMMTAGGNAESVASARSGLVYSLVGLAVVVLAQVIVVFILNRL